MKGAGSANIPLGATRRWPDRPGLGWDNTPRLLVNSIGSYRTKCCQVRGNIGAGPSPIPIIKLSRWRQSPGPIALDEPDFTCPKR